MIDLIRKKKRGGLSLKVNSKWAIHLLYKDSTYSEMHPSALYNYICSFKITILKCVLHPYLTCPVGAIICRICSTVLQEIFLLLEWFRFASAVILFWLNILWNIFLMLPRITGTLITISCWMDTMKAASFSNYLKRAECHIKQFIRGRGRSGLMWTGNAYHHICFFILPSSLMMCNGNNIPHIFYTNIN